MTFVSLGMAILGGLLAIWLIGGVLLRLAGVLLVLAGGLGLALQRDANGTLVLAIGVLLWLAGHWHYALRHHEYKSPLARYVFYRWVPAWLDPTRDWAVAVAPEPADRDARGERGRRG